MTTDTLFPLPEQPLNELDQARARLAKARDAYEEADLWEDQTGNEIPRHIRHELQNAESLVIRLEAEEVKRRLL